jgi:hypothetical protein
MAAITARTIAAHGVPDDLLAAPVTDPASLGMGLEPLNPG